MRDTMQCSPQAVQPRPGPLGLAWLAGLVGPGISTLQVRKTNKRAEEPDRIWVRGTRAASYTYFVTVYTMSGIRVCPTRPTRPEGAPGLVPRPAQARLFVRPVGSTDTM